MIINKYLLKDIIINFISFLVIINMVLVVTQILRVSDILVNFGFSLENILLPLLFIILPTFSLTTPIAFFFAMISSVGRLCLDGEYGVILASGYSLKQLARIPILFAVILFLTLSWSGAYLEGWGRRELMNFLYSKTKTELDNIITNKLQSGVFLSDFMGFILYAEKVSEDRRHLANVMIAPQKNAFFAKPDSESTAHFGYSLTAPKGEFSGSLENGDLSLSLEQSIMVLPKEEGENVSVVRFDALKFDLMKIFSSQFIGSEPEEDDFRSYGPLKLYDYVESLEKDVKRDEKNYLKARYLLHQRFGGSFSLVIFSIMAMIIGISDVRKGRSNTYYLAIAFVIFLYILIMAFKWLAEQGALPAPLAVWGLNIGAFTYAYYLLNKKSTLPMSESLLHLKYLFPFPWRY